MLIKFLKVHWFKGIKGNISKNIFCNCLNIILYLPGRGSLLCSGQGYPWHGAYKGDLPANISYSNTPSAHQFTEKP